MRLDAQTLSSAVSITLQLPAGFRGEASPPSLSSAGSSSTIKLTADSGMKPGQYQATIKAGSTSLPIVISIPKATIRLPIMRR
jgi:hypothetical protein